MDLFNCARFRLRRALFASRLYSAHASPRRRNTLVDIYIAYGKLFNQCGHSVDRRIDITNMTLIERLCVHHSSLALAAS